MQPRRARPRAVAGHGSCDRSAANPPEVGSIPRCGRVGDQVRSPQTSRTDAQIRHPSRRHLCARASCAASPRGCWPSCSRPLSCRRVAADASAQTPFVPYFGKNQIRYDNFQWNIYTTDHFEIYYYPEIEQHLERVAGYAESAYQHDQRRPEARPRLQGAAHRLQDEQRVPAAERHPGRGARKASRAFAEPTRDRMVLPIDEPPDLLYRLITHELTHIFEFDIIPQSLIRRERAAVGERGPVGLHDRLLAPARPDDGARRGGRRHRAEDDRPRGLRRLQQPAPDLQPRARRASSSSSRGGARKACGSSCSRCARASSAAATTPTRRRFKREGRGVRPAVREVPEGPLQAVPRQGAAGRLRPQPRAEPARRRVTRTCSRSSRRRRATSSPS